jgi:flagellar hook protein FlgE
MDLSAIALQGLAQADAQLEAAAIGLASAGTASPDGANLDTVDLSTQILALMAAQNAFAINLATLKTVDQIQKNLIDIKA